MPAPRHFMPNKEPMVSEEFVATLGAILKADKMKLERASNCLHYEAPSLTV